MEKADIYLHANRFDLIIKIVYMYFHVVIKHVPQCILLSYTEHIRVWNGFKETCNDKNPRMNGYYRSCKPKTSKEEFLKSYHKLVDNLRDYGFNSSKSSIPVDVNGVLINGAHRLSSSIVLSQSVCVQHLSYKKDFTVNYKYFHSRGLQKSVIEMVVLEYLKIQLHLNLTSQVTILSLFSKDEKKEKTMRSILRNKCSRDGFIVYEKDVFVTKLGMKQLIIHMYGLQTWIQAKINNMKDIFSKLDLARVRFFFFFGRNSTELKDCKNEIRMLYNDINFKSSVHIPDTPHETLMLAEMILNNSSLQLINNGKHTDKCLDVVTEISKNSFLTPINTLPSLYQSRQDIMLDSGIVLDFYGIRKGTDVDILFLYNVDNTIIGNYNGVQYEAHAFASNVVGDTRPWGEDHLSSNVTKWDLFYNPGNYGYCYGIKFVSLSQISRYKSKRKEPTKDEYDIKLIQSFMKTAV